MESDIIEGIAKAETIAKYIKPKVGINYSKILQNIKLLYDSIGKGASKYNDISIISRKLTKMEELCHNKDIKQLKTMTNDIISVCVNSTLNLKKQEKLAKKILNLCKL